MVWKKSTEISDLFLYQLEASLCSLNYDKNSELTPIFLRNELSENFRFYNEYDDEYNKMFILFWTLQKYLYGSAHVERLVGPCSKKVAPISHK